MEEDIKIIEEYLDKQDRKYVSEYRLMILQAIENIISRNKELEVINKMQEDRISVIDERELIPKSKIKNYIDKIQEKLNKYKVNGMYIAIEGDNSQDFINTLIIQRATLQELLEIKEE